MQVSRIYPQEISQFIKDSQTDEFISLRGEITDYTPMVQSMGNIVVRSDIGSYSGDSIFMLQDRNDASSYGLLTFGWGSCSGCDALQQCSNVEELQQLYDNIQSQIKWFDSVNELKKYIHSKDWELEFIYMIDKDDVDSFIQEVMSYETPI